jgi:hypothetical protein
MTDREFINEVIKLYREAKELIKGDRGYNIKRGVKKTISGKAEDLFALFIATRLDDPELEFWVEGQLQLGFESQQKSKTKPDLIIIRDGRITHLFELKTDMGYKRTFHTTKGFSELQERIGRLRNGQFEEATLNGIPIRVDENLSMHFVVISEINHGRKDNILGMKKAFDALDGVNLYYLSKGTHPNSGDRSERDIIINEDAFNRLFDDIQTNLI